MINGVNPSSYNDYPKEVSYVIFLGGCNFRCPFCHNLSIVEKETEIIDRDYVLSSLIKRQKFIKAVVITGGEPTIHGEELIDLISSIRKLGFKVKLDTNGTNPDLLAKLISDKMIDYIAMDIKNTFPKYEKTAGSKINIDNLKNSIKIIEDSGIDYEFRTTINKTHHTIEDIKEITTYFRDKSKYFLQNYQYSKEQIEKKDFIAFTEEDICALKDMLKVGAKV